jgi:hypothetical protein
MIPWDLHLFAVNRAEKGNAEGTIRGVYSNKTFLFGPAAWGGQKICDREQDFCAARAAGFVTRSMPGDSFASVRSILSRESRPKELRAINAVDEALDRGAVRRNQDQIIALALEMERVSQ